MHKRTVAAHVAAWVLSCASMPGIAGVAGTVDSLGGTVSVARAGSPVQTLTTGATVNEGDQISTASDSWVLLEMADGGSLTLRGKTRMRIDAYSYPENDKSGGKSWLSLIEGAMRSVTGAIGTFNPSGYKLTTPVMTLGIRGTDHETAYYPPGSAEPGVEPGVYDKVNQGETFMHTQRGDVSLKAGQVGFGDHRGLQAPRRLDSIPAFYRKHAEIDRPLANRMRLIQQRREQRIQKLRQHFAEGAKARTHGSASTNAAERTEARQKRTETRQEKQHHREETGEHPARRRPRQNDER